MPSLNELNDFVVSNIGDFERGKWDYIGLAQLYPQLEVLAQLVPRKRDSENYETTIVYQTRNESSGRGAKPGDPIQPTQKKKALRRKVKLVKYVDDVSWVLDEDRLKGKSGDHLFKQVQMDLVEFDLHHWEDLENNMLRIPDSITPADDDPLFGFPAYITDDANIADDTFELFGGDDPYNAGRPGSISVAAQPGYTNPVAKFAAVTDASFFKMLETFLLQRKLMGAVPNPRLLPDTPNDVCYVQIPLHLAITQYLTASNENIGMDAGRYRGQPMYKGTPFAVWHALGHPDSPVKSTVAEAYWIDWNSMNYSVHPEYDRKIEGPTDINLVPGGVYVVSQLWHQLTCDRPDRNLKLVSDAANLQP